MKAILLKEFGPVENFSIEEVDKPEPAMGQLLIDVKAIAISPADIRLRLGNDFRVGRDYVPMIPGWDVSGIVIKTGTGVTSFKPGDEVFGMAGYPMPTGTYAEFVVAPAAFFALKPPGISHEEAAAATMAALAAASALIDLGSVSGDQQVLIANGANGAGHYAIQLAKHLGAHVTGVSGYVHRDFIFDLGADEHIEWGNPMINSRAPFDFALDTSGEYRHQILEHIRWGGVLVSAVPDPRHDFADTAAYRGVRGYADPAEPSSVGMERIAELLEKGIIKSHIFKTFDLDQMADAHMLLESGIYQGKIVLKI